MLGAIAVLCQAVSPVFAASPSMICNNPDILERVAERLRVRNTYIDVDLASVSEEPTGKADVVRCGVCVKVYVYDTARLGPTAAFRCEPHGYFVEALPAGFVLISVE